jgi:hypothetical protein
MQISISESISLETKMQKIKQLTILTLIFCLFTIALTACSTPPLSPDFDEEQVKLVAQDVVSLLNAQDTEGMRAIFTERMNTAITDEVFTQIYSALSEGGEFESIESMTVIGSTDQSTGEEFATVITRAKYAAKTFTYTISFNKDMQVAGLYYK